MKKISLFIFIILSLLTYSNAIAQTNNTEPISCFDYYRFGSVYASLETKNYNNSSGATMNFFGQIKNDNSYPIVDGKLFVKIMRENDSYEKTGGQDEVDSFVVKEGISIPANSSMPINFDWKVPAYAVSGNYQVSTYFLVDDSFNMSGLTFTTDIVGGVVKFEVMGEQKEFVYFDRESITLNNNSYYTVAFTPSISATSSADISLTLTNDTNQIQRVPVTLELYKWDSQANKNLIDTKETTYLIDANSSIKVPYKLIDNKHSVYYLLAKAVYKDAKSEVSVRFSREGAQEPRINFSTFKTYPFEKGVENALITCVHNTNKVDAEYGKVVTKVLDYKGNIIHTSTYEGKITGTIQGMISKFTPNSNYKDLKIETKIFDKNNKIIDETSVEYVCSSLSDDCKEPNIFFNFTTLIIAILLVIIVVLILLRKHFKKKDLIVMLAIPFMVVSFLIPNVTEAKSDFWSGQFNSGIAPNWFSNCLGLNNCAYGGNINTDGLLNGIQMQITYHANVFKIENGIETLLPEGSIVQIGDILRFYNSVGNYLDVFWTGYSYETDTPYGAWVTNADYVIPQDVSVANMTLPANDPGDGFFPEVYALFSVNPPTFSLSQTNYLNCGLPTNNYIDCTVLNPNISNVDLVSITPNFDYGSTYGKFYFPKLGETNNLVNDIGKIVYQHWVDINSQPYWLSYLGDIFVQNIDSVQIPYNLNIKQTVITCGSENTPTKPIINLPDIGTINTNYTASIIPITSSTTYQIDWGKGAGWETVSNPSSVSQTWTEQGTKTVKAKAINNDSLCSIESDSKTIVISEPEGPTDDLVLTASPSCASVSLSWSNNGATSYQVYRKSGTGDFEEVSGIITDRTYTDTGLNNDTSYIYKIYSTKNSIPVISNVVTVTTTCPQCSGDKPNQLPDNGTTCYSQVTCNYYENPPSWQQNPYQCSQANISFNFLPDISNINGSCPLNLVISNVHSCYLKNRLGIQTGNTIFATNNQISIDGEIVYGIGTYSLWCSAANTPDVYQKKSVSNRSCYSNPDIREN